MRKGEMVRPGRLDPRPSSATKAPPTPRSGVDGPDAKPASTPSHRRIAMAAPSSDHAHFDRSIFAMELDSLELTETIRNLERLIDSPRIQNQTRVSLRFAIDALRRELG
jgi:hypothetical protein